MAPATSGLIDRQLEIYKEEAGRWSVSDEEEESARCHLEKLVCRSLFIFELLNGLDEVWYSDVHDGRMEYSTKTEDRLLLGYRLWYDRCKDLLSSLERFEQKGSPIRDAEALRAACREAAGILTPDDEFFDDETFVKLQEDALDSFHRGECRDLGELTN